MALMKASKVANTSTPSTGGRKPRKPVPAARKAISSLSLFRRTKASITPSRAAIGAAYEMSLGMAKSTISSNVFKAARRGEKNPHELEKLPGNEHEADPCKADEHRGDLLAKNIKYRESFS